MDPVSVAPFVLVEVSADGKEQVVSGHADFGSGWQAGTSAVHAERDKAFSLYRDGRRVARFCHCRITAKFAARDFERMVIAL